MRRNIIFVVIILAALGGLAIYLTQPKEYIERDMLYMICEEFDKAWFEKEYASFSPCVIEVDKCVRECNRLLESGYPMDSRPCIMDSKGDYDSFDGWICAVSKPDNCTAYADDKNKYTIILDEGCNVVAVDFETELGEGYERL